MEQVQCIIMMLSLGLSIITNQTDLKESTYQAENPIINQSWQECSLPQEEWPDYYYFTNEGHYRLVLVNETAFVVKEYAINSGLENEEWELKRIYSCGSSNAFLAYVESIAGNELYILFSDGAGAQPIILFWLIFGKMQMQMFLCHMEDMLIILCWNGIPIKIVSMERRMDSMSIII